MKKVIDVLKESGEFHDSESYLVYGNPADADKVIIIEKSHFFEKARDVLTNPAHFLLVCGMGIPSKDCLKFLDTIKGKRFFYFGDLDPTSFYVYLSCVYGKRDPKSTDKKQHDIKFLGLTLTDYEKFVKDKDVTIKLSEPEATLLAGIEKFNLTNLKKEIEFLKKGQKVEMEAMALLGIDRYLEEKLHEE